MTKISIVIPIYNVEKYITQCIESILNQTLKDIEIICVDDGSTDNCPQILDNYALKDSRIKVIHQPNGGYGKAMNTGLDAASGKYIGIVESDDFILPEMYETLYNCAEKNNVDIVKSDYSLYWSMLEQAVNSHNYKCEKYYNKILGRDDREIFLHFAPSNWTGIYKTDFIRKNNIRHHETPGASYQDTGFWFQAMSMCESFMIVDKAFYMYRQDNPASSMKRRDKLRDITNECEWVGDILKSHGLEYEWKLCKFYQQINHFSTFYRIDNSLKKEYAHIIKEDYTKYKDLVSPFITEKHRYTFEFLEKISADPDGVCNEIIKNIEETKTKLDSADEIIIYGAGLRALKVCYKLHDMGYYNKITCAAVTSTPEKETIFGIPVKCIDEVQKHENQLVLLSVKKGTPAYSEIEQKLHELDFTMIADTESL